MFPSFRVVYSQLKYLLIFHKFVLIPRYPLDRQVEESYFDYLCTKLKIQIIQTSHLLLQS